MKKSIFIGVLGMAAVSATSSFGQGAVFFSSYTANQNAGAPTTFFSGGSGLVGVPFTAELYYFLGTVSDPVNNALPTSITSDVTGLTLLNGVSAALDNSGSATGANGLGYFDGGTVVIPGYGSGPVTFEVVEYNGSTYDTSSIRGRTGSWTESLIQPTSLPAGNFGDNGVMPSGFVAVVPEPTTLALAGLGGLASLVALRRKQA
jgi:hypothetical protein